MNTFNRGERNPLRDFSPLKEETGNQIIPIEIIPIGIRTSSLKHPILKE